MGGYGRYRSQWVNLILVACEESQHWVTRTSGEEQSDPAERSLVKKHFFVSRLRLYFNARLYSNVNDFGMSKHF